MAKYTIFDFLRDKWGSVPPVVTTDLSGKNVLVIGANTGLGLEAARHFATMNPARLFLGCRNQAKGEAAVKDIETTTGYRNITLWLVDLGDFTSVVEFADKFEADDIKLDIVVANAGVASNTYETSRDGWEKCLQVNHLSTSLLSILLLPRMERAAAEGLSKPRLVIVSSDVHFWAKIPDEATTAPNILQRMSEESYCDSIGMSTRYFESKLLNVFLVHALTSRLSPNSPIIVNAVHPGHCKSGLFRELRFPLTIIYALVELIFAKSCEKGSRNLVWAAVGTPKTVRGKEDSDGMASLRGAFVSHAQVEECGDYALSEEGKVIEERIWNETTEILSKASPKVSKIVDNLQSL